VLSALFDERTTALEIGDSIAGSYCGRLLRDLGAQVTKVEPDGGSPLRTAGPFLETPQGEHLSATYLASNAGKDVVTADLDTARGRQTVVELIARQPDFVLMSGAAAYWKARDLTPERIHEVSPKSIIGRTTLFGERGPNVNLIGGELQVQALGGLMNMVGDRSREPVRIGGYQAQYCAGLALLNGFAIGMFEREQTGVGNSFSTSALETVSHVEWKSSVTFQASGQIDTRGDDDAPAIIRAKDGFFALFYRPSDWPTIKAIMKDGRLDDPRFATQAGREEYRAELLAVLDDCAKDKSKRDLYHATQAVRMTTGYTATMGDLLDSDQYRAREFFEPLEVPGLGSGRLPGAPWRVAAERPATRQQPA
jgi:crotonobetainyl-CoA:carnitine CoA-transferase CaiB-like acyl-CoA transferase